MEFSRAGIEAASLATTTVDEAVEQLVAGWATNVNIDQRPRRSATRQNRQPHNATEWGNFDFDEEAPEEGIMTAAVSSPGLAVEQLQSVQRAHPPMPAHQRE